MPSAILFAFSLALSLIPTHTRACDSVEEKTAHPESTCVVGATWEGQSGTWFHYTVVPELRRKLILYPNLEAQVTSYRLIDNHREQEMASLRSAIERYKQGNSYLQQEAEAKGVENARLRAELDKGRPWYTSPIFWGIVGFVAGAAIQHACCGPGK